MRKFLKNISIFFLIIFTILGILIFSPTPYAASQSILFSSVKKDSLLQNTPQPRIILIGGSNASYGIDSRIIKDSLGYNVINTSIHAGLGLKYMLDNTEPHLKENDVCVIIPEYEQFHDKGAYGSEQLLRMVLDVSLSNVKKLDFNQIKQIYKFIPQYIKSKLIIKNYYKPALMTVYRHTAFNEYGDAYLHWDRGRTDYLAFQSDNTAKFDENFYNYFVSCIDRLQSKGVRVYISFPGMQDVSYGYNEKTINEVYNRFNNSHLKLLGRPKDYIIPDSLTYDTPYHLIREGVEKRTNTLASFLKENLDLTNSPS